MLTPAQRTFPSRTSSAIAAQPLFEILVGLRPVDLVEVDDLGQAKVRIAKSSGFHRASCPGSTDSVLEPRSQFPFAVLLVQLGDVAGLHVTAVDQDADPPLDRLALGQRERLAALGIRTAGAERAVVTSQPLVRILVFRMAEDGQTFLRAVEPSSNVSIQWAALLHVPFWLMPPPELVICPPLSTENCG